METYFLSVLPLRLRWQVSRNVRQRFEELSIVLHKLSNQFYSTVTLLFPSNSYAEICILTVNTHTRLSQLAITLSICQTYESLYPTFSNIASTLPHIDRAIIIQSLKIYCGNSGSPSRICLHSSNKHQSGIPHRSRPFPILISLTFPLGILDWLSSSNNWRPTISGRPSDLYRNYNRPLPQVSSEKFLLSLN